METDSSSQEYFGLSQSFVPWRAESGLYDNGKDTRLHPGAGYKLLEHMVCGLSILRF